MTVTKKQRELWEAYQGSPEWEEFDREVKDKLKEQLRSQTEMYFRWFFHVTFFVVAAIAIPLGIKLIIMAWGTVL